VGTSVGMSPHQPDTEDDRSDFRTKTRCDGGGGGCCGFGGEVVGSCVSDRPMPTPTHGLIDGGR
jgi:hypothetical protein